MSSAENETTDEHRYVDKNTGEKYKHKLVWREDKVSGVWNIAYGNDYRFTASGVMIFEGAKGDIVMSPTMEYTIK